MANPRKVEELSEIHQVGALVREKGAVERERNYELDSVPPHFSRLILTYTRLQSSQVLLRDAGRLREYLAPAILTRRFHRKHCQAILGECRIAVIVYAREYEVRFGRRFRDLTSRESKIVGPEDCLDMMLKRISSPGFPAVVHRETIVSVWLLRMCLFHERRQGIPDEV